MDFKEIEFPSSLFISGIGTDVGKSFATGWLAREMNAAGKRCITQKMVQTGNRDFSEDIERHRKIMGIPFQEEDLSGLTAPIIFTYPASPHLAAEIDGRRIDLSVVDKAAEELRSRYPHLLIEGAGGLMVPIEGDYLAIDYIRDSKLPLVLVVTGQLGSINHALLSLHAVQSYGIPLFAVVYNPYFDKDDTICAETRKYLQNWVSCRFPHAHWMEMPSL